MTPEEQEDLGWAMCDILWGKFRDEWPEGEWAYDGSAWPQRKELSPRDRDILTRILNGWWFKLIELDHEAKGLPGRPSYIGAAVTVTSEMLNHPSISWMRMDVDECKRLLDIRAALDPRQD